MEFRRIAITERNATGWTKVSLASGNVALVLYPLPNQGPKVRDIHPDCPLTERELQVVSCLALGMNNKAIGVVLCLSHFTIKSHLTRIARRLETGDRAHMVAICIRKGWIA